MNFDQQVKVKYDAKEKKVSISIMVNEEFVVVKKVSIDQYRYILAQMNAVISEVDNK